MKKLTTMLLSLLFCLLCAAALAADVPASTKEIPARPGFPDVPRIVRVQREGFDYAITLDRDLPNEHLVTVLAIDADSRRADRNMAQAGSRVWRAGNALPMGGSWCGVEIAWVGGGDNALARYNTNGGLEKVIAYDGRFNEFVYNANGTFYEYGDAASGVRARFDSKGKMTSYGYKALRNTVVWFNLQGKAFYAEYDDGALAASWEKQTGWYISTGSGRIRVSLNVNPASAAPLLPPSEEEAEEKVTWYPNNTIGLAGLSLQEANKRLPDKWYNVIPVNLTAEGRQTFFLVITNNKFIGECYVDVYGDTVTVSYDLIENGSIEVKSHYGRWFTSLGDITTSSIEANDNAILFGEPMSISRDLGGADVALLFIRSKATYRMPFADGTALTEYWRNKPEWKEFRKNLTMLMKYVEW